MECGGWVNTEEQSIDRIRQIIGCALTGTKKGGTEHVAFAKRMWETMVDFGLDGRSGGDWQLRCIERGGAYGIDDEYEGGREIAGRTSIYLVTDGSQEDLEHALLRWYATGADLRQQLPYNLTGTRHTRQAIMHRSELRAQIRVISGTRYDWNGYDLHEDPVSWARMFLFPLARMVVIPFFAHNAPTNLRAFHEEVGFGVAHDACRAIGYTCVSAFGRFFATTKANGELAQGAVIWGLYGGKKKVMTKFADTRRIKGAMDWVAFAVDMLAQCEGASP